MFDMEVIDVKTRYFIPLSAVVVSAFLLAGCAAKNTPAGNTDQGNDPAVGQVSSTPAPTPTGAGGFPNNGNWDPNNWGEWDPSMGGPGNPNGGENNSTPSPVPDPVITSAVTAPTATPDPEPDKPVEVRLGFDEDGKFAFAEANTFYTKDVRLTITAPAGSTVYYTLDGSIPDETGTVYAEPLVFEAHGSRFPEAAILRVRVKDSEGQWSKTAARTYLTGTKLSGRFSTLVFSISGNPKDLFEGPDGMFYGENYLNPGRASERMV